VHAPRILILRTSIRRRGCLRWWRRALCDPSSFITLIRSLVRTTSLKGNKKNKTSSREKVGLASPAHFIFSGRKLPRPECAGQPDPPMVGIRSPIGLVVGSCISHPGVLGSIHKREEPGKTGAPCVKVPGSSRVPPPPSRTAL
jgi:hypothetical protein